MSKDFVNESIYARKIILIDENGNKVGETFRNDALKRAKDLGLDLVQVNGDERSQSPICKIMDYGKMKYEKSKIKAQKPQKEKEIMYHTNISSHDLQTKKNHVKEILEKGHKIKFGIETRRRERYTLNDVKEMLKQQVADFVGIAKFNDICVSDKSVFVVLNPIK